MKYTLEYIKEQFYLRGYVLLEEEYKNSHTKMKCLCPNGHQIYKRWGDLQQGYGCNECTKLDSDYVLRYIESFDYKVLSSYDGCNKKMYLKCPKGHKCSISFGMFRLGRRCMECFLVRNRYSGDKIKQELKARGFELLSKYRSSGEHIRVRCENGHVFDGLWNSIRDGHGCHECRKTDFRLIEEYTDSRGYKMLSTADQYKNVYSKLLFKCPNGHKVKMSWKSFYTKGSDCIKCSKKVSKISQGWLDSLDIPKLKREYRININSSFVQVDGFDPETNTVYEFLGDYWHGNPEIYNSEETNLHNKKKFGLLYKEWLDRKFILEDLGYKVVYIWESKFKSRELSNESKK